MGSTPGLGSELFEESWLSLVLDEIGDMVDAIEGRGEVV